VIDERFYTNKGPLPLTKIAKHLECELVAPNIASKEIEIANITTLELAQSSDLTFLSNKKYEKAFKHTKAGACLVNNNYAGEVPENTWLLKSDNPYLAYAKAIDMFYTSLGLDPKDSGNSRDPLIKSEENAGKMIDPTALIGFGCKIGHNVVIEAGAQIGDNAVIGAFTFIGRGVKIGNNARIDSHVAISYSIIGDDVVILPGARIGQDGFGFATAGGRHRKIFHVGRVIIGDDVEIGANTTIDRGGILDTVISDGCRIDNLVQIGHNVFIGKGSIVVAQVGIAGSSKIGSYCALGGQVGVSGHVQIADRVQIAGQGGVIQDITEPGSILGGSPTVPIMDWHRQSIFLKKMSGKK
jgi:UDP-3-O-[3-hydroxymyristoyl] glucosamine N-acyltransferase